VKRQNGIAVIGWAHRLIITEIYVIQIAPAGHSYHERKRNGEWTNESAAKYSLI
jgi:hypothetical protein